MSTSRLIPTLPPDRGIEWYNGYMKIKKKPTKQVRMSLRAYEFFRRLAFKAHKPMVQIIDEWVVKNREV